MDMLYRAYSNPLNLMNMYINQGRFGTFVDGFLKAEYERKKEEAEKDNESKLWLAYIHSNSEESYEKWKKRVCNVSADKSQSGCDEELGDDGVEAIITKLFPNKKHRKNGGE